jgi:uncharacterized protein (UPF0371 family)
MTTRNIFEAEACRDVLRSIVDSCNEEDLAKTHVYIRRYIAEVQLQAVRSLLEKNGCDCNCEHHHEEHDGDCERCLACRIGEAVGK